MGEALSDIYGVTAPSLVGVWMHAPAAPDVTERHFPYKAGERAEAVGVDVTELRLNGRAYPMAEFGEGESESITATIIIPHDEDHDAGVQWWRDAIRARRVVCYRDNRSRLIFGHLGKAVAPSDVKQGTAIAFTVTRLDFTEAV